MGQYSVVVVQQRWELNEKKSEQSLALLDHTICII